MKIAVTGAAGFIGTWLCAELDAAGHQVFGMDQRPGPWVLDQFDLLERHAALRWLADRDPEVVVHLAAQVGRVFGEDDVTRTIRANAEMTALVARAAAEEDVQLVYASTSEVYGDQGGRECHEDRPWVLPHNLYGLTKGWGEQVCRLYSPWDLIIVRLSMPYGPGSPPGRGRRAMDTMLWQAHHRMPILVHQGAARSWCWVGDTVRGIRLAIEADPRYSTWSDVYNIGRDDDMRSMLEIAQMACKLADCPDELIAVVPPDGPQTLVKHLPTDRLRDLGWAPTVELDEGMARVYEWVSGFDGNGHRI